MPPPPPGGPGGECRRLRLVDREECRHLHREARAEECRRPPEEE